MRAARDHRRRTGLAARSSTGYPGAHRAPDAAPPAAEIGALLGIDIPDADVRRILESLGFALRDAERGMGCHRSDASGGRAPRSRPDRGDCAPLRLRSAFRHAFPRCLRRRSGSTRAVARARELRAVMTGVGFSEAVTFGFIAARAAARLRRRWRPRGRSPTRCRRTSRCCGRRVLPGLIDAVAYNRRREQRDVRLFEIGARFSRDRW